MEIVALLSVKSMTQRMSGSKSLGLKKKKRHKVKKHSKLEIKEEEERDREPKSSLVTEWY